MEASGAEAENANGDSNPATTATTTTTALETNVVPTTTRLNSDGHLARQRSRCSQQLQPHEGSKSCGPVYYRSLTSDVGKTKCTGGRLRRLSSRDIEESDTEDGQLFGDGDDPMHEARLSQEAYSIHDACFSQESFSTSSKSSKPPPNGWVYVYIFPLYMKRN